MYKCLCLFQMGNMHTCIQQSWEMKMFERVWNVIKRDHEQIWLLLSAHPSPLQDVVSVEGAMTSTRIQMLLTWQVWPEKGTDSTSY